MTTTPDVPQEVQAADAAREYIGAIGSVLLRDMTTEQRKFCIGHANKILSDLNAINEGKSNLEVFGCTMLVCDAIMTGFHKSMADRAASKVADNG